MSRSERSIYWSNLVEDQKSSGQSITAFCRDREISMPSFYAWRRKLKSLDADSAVETNFVPLAVVDNSSSGIEIKLPGDVTVRLPRDRELIRDFVDALLGRDHAS